MTRLPTVSTAHEFHGYEQARRPAPDAELTAVEPGTPCGEYLRRFWHPLAMTAEVADVPLRVRLLGEDLVLFRDRSGRYGLLHLHCSHRNTSLEFGVVEQCGLRCCYHGWLYDVDGTVLETPGEPAGSKRKNTVRHGAYPVIDYHGLLFAYLGPHDQQPVFPVYDTFEQPDDELVPYSLSYPCNWLQVCENTLDPMHAVFLHTRVTSAQFTPSFGALPHIEYHEGRHNIHVTSAFRWEGNVWLRTHDTVLPNFSQVGVFYEDAVHEKYYQGASITKWTVPEDDTHCRILGWRHFGPVIDPHGYGRREAVGKETIDFLGQTANRPYTERQRDPGDYEAQVSQGPVNVHAAEHLGTSDRGIALFRRRLRREIRALAEHGTPPPVADARGGVLASWVQDSVIPIPPRDDLPDADLLKAVATAAIDVFERAAALPFDERVATISQALESFRHDPRFVRR